MSSEQGGIQPSTLIIIVCIVGVFALALYCAYKTHNRHGEAVQAFARSHGWPFSRKDDQGLQAKIEALFLKEQYDPYFIINVETGQRSLIFFNCSYTNREYRKSRPTGTGCLVTSPRFAAVKHNVELYPYSKIDEKLGTGEIKADNPEFNKRYLMYSEDEDAAKRIVNPELQAVLIEHASKPIYNPVRVGLGPAGAVLMTGENIEPERWMDLIELSRKVEGTVK